MLILITAVLLFATTATLLLLRLLRPQFRFAWLIAVCMTFLAWITVLLWRAVLPLSISFGAWEPQDLLATAPVLMADGVSWVYAASLVTLALAALLTATTRQGFPDTVELAVSVAVCGLGLLAATAGNPLTLALTWAAVDLAELLSMLRMGNGREAAQRIVTVFAVHAAAIILLIMAQVVSSTAAQASDFAAMTPAASLLLIPAAGLRLGVLPIHLPYVPGSSLRRGMGTTIRLSSAAAGLVVLSRIPSGLIPSLLTVLIMLLAAGASLYAGWMWLRAPDELNGRPFWIIGLAGLALYATLRGDPIGAAAWGAAMVLAGGALFLSSAQQVWLNRALFIGAWAVSSLPFSLSASGWNGQGGILSLAVPVCVVAQALLMAGFIKHASRPSQRTPLQAQPTWTRSVYPVGIGLLLTAALVLGLTGWEGASQLGAVVPGLIASLLCGGLLWAVPRFPILNPVPAHWLRPSSDSLISRMYARLAGLYGTLAGTGRTISDVLEGEAGLMWSLLFLVLLVIMIVQRNP